MHAHMATVVIGEILRKCLLCRAMSMITEHETNPSSSIKMVLLRSLQDGFDVMSLIPFISQKMTQIHPAI